MNKKIIIALSIILCVFVATYITIIIVATQTIDCYKTTIVYKDSIYNNAVDSLNNEIIQNEELIQCYKNQVDSYEILVDSLYEDIDVYKIKLDRIKEYNRIAGKGNNITFLRGWINRVLNQ